MPIYVMRCMSRAVSWVCGTSSNALTSLDSAHELTRAIQSSHTQRALTQTPCVFCTQRITCAATRSATPRSSHAQQRTNPYCWTTGTCRRGGAQWRSRVTQPLAYAQRTW